VDGAVIALLTTIDPVKLGAVRAVLAGEGIASELFDTAAGALWRAVIPVRLMVGRVRRRRRAPRPAPGRLH
jgi:hypothetical protein